MKKQILIVTASLLIAPLGAVAQTQVSGSAAASATATTTTTAATRTTAATKSATAAAITSTSGRTGGEAALQATASAGLPTSQVENTIAEGRARGATRARIDQAAVAAHARLEASRRSLREESGRGENGRTPSAAEIEAGASAMAAGATSQELVVIRRAAARDRSLVVSLETLATLRSEGSGSSAAAEIAAMLKAGATDSALESRLSGAGFATTAERASAGVDAGVTATADAALGGFGGNLGVAGVARGWAHSLSWERRQGGEVELRQSGSVQLHQSDEVANPTIVCDPDSEMTLRYELRHELSHGEACDEALSGSCRKHSSDGWVHHNRHHMMLILTLDPTGAGMRTTINLDEELLAEAQRLTGTAERSTLVHEGLRALIQRESARRLAMLGGSEPDLRLAPRRRSSAG